MQPLEQRFICRVMANKPLEKLLVEAQRAYQKRDKSLGARLIDEILQRDLNYPGAWDLLYHLFGGGKAYDEFQRAFVSQYYPDKLPLLQPRPVASVAVGPPAKTKTSFWNRLFGGAPKAVGEPSRSSPPIHQPAIPVTPVQAALTPAVEQPAGLPAAPALAVGAFAMPLPVSTEKVRVILVDDIQQTRETIARSLRFQENIEVIGSANSGLQAIHLTRELKPDVIVMDVNMPDMDGIAATAIIKRDLPATEVIILTVQDDTDYMRRAMLAGARDFLAKPPMIDDLVQSVLRAGQQAHLGREKQPSLPSVRHLPVAASGGKIISVYSPRGGSGCTTIAANLAVALHSEDTPVVVVDADLQFGDIPVLFDSVSKLSILDLTPRVAELDAEIINTVLASHPSGIKLLHPPRPERAELVAGPHLSQLLTILSNQFAYVIVDTSHRLSETTRAALETSQLILLVSTLDIPSMARVRKFLEMIPLLNLEPERVMLAVNQFDPRIGVKSEKLAQAFGKEAEAIIPLAFDPVLDSINRGAPLLLRKDDAALPVGQALLKLARFTRSRLAELEKQALEKTVAAGG